jgi:hypothetical protein
MIELEEVLPEINDIATLKTITKSRPVPAQLRTKIWQVCMLYLAYAETDVSVQFQC